MEDLSIANEEISAKIFGSKFCSNKEYHIFLPVEANGYLPS